MKRYRLAQIGKRGSSNQVNLNQVMEKQNTSVRLGTVPEVECEQSFSRSPRHFEAVR